MRLPLIPVLVCAWFFLSRNVNAHAAVANDLLMSRSTVVEEAVFQNCGSESNNDYRQKMRSLYLNLKGKENPALRESVVSGDLSAKKLAGMSSAVSGCIIMAICYLLLTSLNYLGNGFRRKEGKGSSHCRRQSFQIVGCGRTTS
jgi:hypothetical protein